MSYGRDFLLFIVILKKCLQNGRSRINCDHSECGAIAQLGERYDGIVEVRSSILLGSTNQKSISMISSQKLETIAASTLSHIADQFESQTDLDVDLQGLQLTICGEMHQTFLLNFHSPTQQMWLSSPVTGAHHFHWDGMWVCTRTAVALNEILSADIRQLFRETISL